MQQTSPSNIARIPFLGTQRRDIWWIGPLATAFGLVVFAAYAVWAAAQGAYYHVGSYHSPFYPPFSLWQDWPYSPAFLTVWVPAGFRFTCYYFRKAYYRSFFLTPPACAVGARPQSYRGERGLLIFQNLHRYFLYLALVFLGFQLYDLYHAFWFADGFGVGLGTVVMLLDVAFLVAYVFGCNSFRHLIGGNVNCFSCASFGHQRHQAWKWSSMLNLHHGFWAWISLVWVCLTDLYIRLMAMGYLTDFRIV